MDARVQGATLVVVKPTSPACTKCRIEADQAADCFGTNRITIAPSTLLGSG